MYVGLSDLHRRDERQNSQAERRFQSVQIQTYRQSEGQHRSAIESCAVRCSRLDHR